MTCVWLCLGSPCFNKHLDAQRGPASLNTAALAQTRSLHNCTHCEHAARVFVVFVWSCVCPNPTLAECLTGASPLCRPALAGWHVGLAPDLLP